MHTPCGFGNNPPHCLGERLRDVPWVSDHSGSPKSLRLTQHPLQRESAITRLLAFQHSKHNASSASLKVVGWPGSKSIRVFYLLVLKTAN